MHPFRAIFQIPKADPPKLTNPDEWSPSLNDFLQRCLIKDPLKRPHPAELLQHPFVCTSEEAEEATQDQLLAALVRNHLASIHRWRQLASNEDTTADAMTLTQNSSAQAPTTLCVHAPAHAHTRTHAHTHTRTHSHMP